ncbi:MAG: class I SAM-dependent methyltransferase [Gemmatimonadetes bacterium]|nr:class I SAM-dependent methyltransferase [Gemmatimonadota bacterium]
MDDSEALDLLRAAIGDAEGEVWADLGAGGGTFTRALAALVGTRGQVVAVDADERALAGLMRWAELAKGGPEIVIVSADIAKPFALPIVDGVVMANVLHFMHDPAAVLGRIAGRLRPGGRLVLIEYEGRRPSPWVPYPVSFERFAELAAGAGLTPPRIAATRPSAFGGEMYVAVARTGEPMTEG